MSQTQSLKTKDLALMANRLQAPVVMADILGKRGDLSDDVRFGLHDLLSDMQPDSALLSMALTVRAIASTYAPASASMGVMAMECVRITEEYGPLWLAHAQAEDTDSLAVANTLSNIIEDFECFIELLELNIDFLKAKDTIAAEIFEILFVQARAHLLIAETFFQALSFSEANAVMGALPAKAGDIDPALAHQMLGEANAQSNNVILFPGARRA